MHYQAYLLEGIARWNSDRGRAIVDGDIGRAAHYNTALSHEVDPLSNIIYGHSLDESYRDPLRIYWSVN